MRGLLIPLTLAVALAPLASAQLPPAPTPVYRVEIANAAPAFGDLVANGSATAGFQVILTLGNVVCANQVTIPVTLASTISGAPPNMAVAIDPSVINFTIAQGPHGSGAGAPAGGGTGEAIARATITGNITANASAQVSIVASAPAPDGPPTGCQGAGPIGAATSEPVVIFANMTATPQPPPVEPTPEDTPGFGVVAALAAVAIALLARRRKA